jgi:hypothetical protein
LTHHALGNDTRYPVRLTGDQPTWHELGIIVVDLYAATKLLYPHPEYYVPPFGRANARGCAAVANIFYRVMHRHHAL